MFDYSRIREDMDVFDIDGDKIGTVGQVHVPAGVPGPAGTPGAPGSTPGGVMQVDPGFLGLGKELYIPFSVVGEVRRDGVHLEVDRDNLDRMGWDQRPVWLV